MPPLHFGKLQIWDDQSLLWNTTPIPPISESFRFGMTKVYSGKPPISESFRFGMTKVYSGIPPPISENFRFGMTKVYSKIPPPPHFGKLQIWDDQSLLRNTPHFGKLQIWDDQSLLRNTPPFRKTSDLDDQSLLPEYPPPISENFGFGMTKVYSGIPPHFGKLQIWDNQSLLQNTPPPNEKLSDVRDFQNTESYYMWRLYPTRITTSSPVNPTFPHSDVHQPYSPI